jgi:hypothetical protein
VQEQNFLIQRAKAGQGFSQLLISDHVLFGRGCETTRSYLPELSSSAGVLAPGVVEHVASDTDHPGKFGSQRNVVQAPPSDLEHLFYEVYNVGVGQGIGATT